MNESTTQTHKEYITEFPVEETIIQTVETELTHPAGFGTLDSVSELCSAIVREWVENSVSHNSQDQFVDTLIEECTQLVESDCKEVYHTALCRLTSMGTETEFPTVFESAAEVEQPSISDAHSLVMEILENKG